MRLWLLKNWKIKEKQSIIFILRSNYDHVKTIELSTGNRDKYYYYKHKRYFMVTFLLAGHKLFFYEKYSVA